LVGERDFPLSLAQLNDLVKNPAEFAGSALQQSMSVASEINKLTKGEVSEVDLKPLI
jgi:adenylosuccinate lyase